MYWAWTVALLLTISADTVHSLCVGVHADLKWRKVGGMIAIKETDRARQQYGRF